MSEQLKPLSLACAERVTSLLSVLQVNLQSDIEELAAKKPQITDERLILVRAVEESALLAGEKNMLKKVFQTLGLTEPS